MPAASSSDDAPRNVSRSVTLVSAVLSFCSFLDSDTAGMSYGTSVRSFSNVATWLLSALVANSTVSVCPPMTRVTLRLPRLTAKDTVAPARLLASAW